MEEFFELGSTVDLLRSEGILYLIVTFVTIFVAKVIHNLLSPYDLAKELTDHDNKAVSLSFAGYLFGVGLILYGIISTDGGDRSGSLLMDIGSTLAWGAGGILLLIVARLCNDKILLSKFCNTKELVEDRNVGTGAVECGSMIGSALIINGALSGDDSSFINGVLSTLFFFILGQGGFIFFGFIYSKALRFDLHDEIEKDNVSSGVSYGFNLVAIGLLVSGFIRHSDSIPGFFILLFFAAFLLLSSRYMVDKLILPGSLLDEEIAKDQNWGASLIEGASALVIALIVNAAFF